MFNGADTDQMRTVAGGLESTAQAIEDLLKAVRTQAKALVWTGPDALQFQGQVDWALLVAQVSVLGVTRNNGAALRAHAGRQDEVSATLDGHASGGFGFGMFPPPTFLGPPGGGGGGLGSFDPQLTFHRDDWTHSFGAQKFLDDAVDIPRPGGWNLDLDLWGKNADVAFRRYGTSGATAIGALGLAGGVTATLLSATASTSAGFTADGNSIGAYVKGSAGAYLVNANATGTATFGAVTAAGTVGAMVGASAAGEGRVSIGPNGLVADAKAEAFAGAKVSADASVDVGGVGAGAHAEAWAGVGFKAEAQATVTADKVEAHVALGAALGIGGSLDFDVKIEPKKIMNEVTSWMHW